MEKLGVVRSAAASLEAGKTVRLVALVGTRGRRREADTWLVVERGKARARVRWAVALSDAGDPYGARAACGQAVVLGKLYLGGRGRASGGSAAPPSATLYISLWMAG